MDSPEGEVRVEYSMRPVLQKIKNKNGNEALNGEREVGLLQQADLSALHQTGRSDRDQANEHGLDECSGSEQERVVSPAPRGVGVERLQGLDGFPDCHDEKASKEDYPIGVIALCEPAGQTLSGTS